MNRVVHFEIPSENPAQSMKFYEKVFGWKFTQFGKEEYWMAETGQAAHMGINGAVMKRKHPQQPMTNAIEVENIDKALETIAASGGAVVVPKMDVGGMGWAAYFKDTDGVIMGVWQTAKK
jgi:uncharacterized protein